LEVSALERERGTSFPRKKGEGEAVSGKSETEKRGKRGRGNELFCWKERRGSLSLKKGEGGKEPYGKAERSLASCKSERGGRGDSPYGGKKKKKKKKKDRGKSIEGGGEERRRGGRMISPSQNEKEKKKKKKTSPLLPTNREILNLPRGEEKRREERAAQLGSTLPEKGGKERKPVGEKNEMEGLPGKERGGGKTSFHCTKKKQRGYLVKEEGK